MILLTTACLAHESSDAYAQASAQLGNKSSNIPMSISSVDTRRVGESLIRVIQHNMEINPIVEVERLSTPDLKREQFLVVSKLPINSEELNLATGSGAYLEEVIFNDSSIEFVFEYFYKKGGSDIVKCNLPVSPSIKKLTCHK
jgi:hypothetical protein